jgi:hypothetical protein
MSRRRWSPLVLLMVVFLVVCGGSDADDPFDIEDETPDPPPADTTTTPTATEKPDTLPWFSSLSLFSAESHFNKRIGANPVIDPDSDEMIQGFIAERVFQVQLTEFSTPVYFADAETPKVEVSVPCGSFWETGVTRMIGVPIPTHAQPGNDASGTSPPVGCGEASDQDNNMVVLDLANRCMYEFWQARTAGNAWTASWGNSLSMDGTGIYDKGLSIRAAGWAFLGGVIWPDEIANGQVDHALVFSYPKAGTNGPVPPATEHHGSYGGSDQIPEGALLQLNPDLDLSTLGLTAYEMPIARALQEYGLYLSDRTDEGTGLYAVDPLSVSTDPWAGMVPQIDPWFELPNIPVDQMRVLEIPAQITGWEDNVDVVNSLCHTWG